MFGSSSLLEDGAELLLNRDRDWEKDMSYKLVRPLAALVIEIVFLGACSFAQQSKPAFQLVLNGPFVVCEESDGAHVRILVPDLSSLIPPHTVPHFTTAMKEYEFADAGEYEIRYLRSGRMTLQAVTNSLAQIVQRQGTCPTQGYFVSLRLSKPDEIWPLLPFEAVVGDDCYSGKRAKWSTQLILRYTAVNLSEVKFWDGKEEKDPELVSIGGEATMEFAVRPVGDDPGHDPSAYAAMAKMINIRSCVHNLTTSSMAPQQKRTVGEKDLKNPSKGFVPYSGHYDCHAPLILLCKNCAINPK